MGETEFSKSNNGTSNGNGTGRTATGGRTLTGGRSLTSGSRSDGYSLERQDTVLTIGKFKLRGKTDDLPQ